MFTKADNKMFENELRGLDNLPEADLVTNGEEMTQLHFSNLDGIQDVPLNEDSDATMNGGRETSTPNGVAPPARRDADGQPSPKRAKGDDDPPPYDEQNRSPPEMQERTTGGKGILGGVRPTKIGQHAEKMMDRVRDDVGFG
jgi:hypothetical protein